MTVQADAARRGGEPLGISVVVCTRNRAKTLAASLDAILADAEADPAVEVLVVDNGSFDETAIVVAERSGGPVPVRYLVASTPGLPHARNLGWRAAEHEIVFYLDDDSVPEPGALRGLRACYEHHWDGSSPIVVGTRVLAELPPGRHEPSWLDDRYRPYLTRLDLGTADLHLPPTQGLVGASFSAPRTTLASIGGFNPKLGAYGMDERWIEEQVMKAGGARIYCGASIVQHPITEDRLRVSWFRNRLFREGRAWKLMEWQLGRLPVSAFVAMTIRHSGGVVLHGGLALGALVIGRRPTAFAEMCRTAFCAGCLAAHVAILRGDTRSWTGATQP